MGEPMNALGPISDKFSFQNGGVRGSWGSKNQHKSILGEVLGGLGGMLGPKSSKRSAKLVLRHPFSPQVGRQNQSKIHPEAIEKVIVFLITFGIDFWSDLVPTWLQLGSQNPPKMEPSWNQNRCKLRY